MRTSTIPRSLAVILLTVAAAVIGFFAGRAGVSDQAALVAEHPDAAPTTLPTQRLSMSDRSSPSNLRVDLIRALGQPMPEGARAVRLTMNAWLAADGAAAILAARDDPDLGDIADRMTLLALYAYPEIFRDNPALLDAIPEQSITMAASSMVLLDPDGAREMMDAHLAGAMYGDAMVDMVGQIDHQDALPPPLQDPRAELEDVLAERNMMRRIPRLHRLITRVAANDPLAAAELLDDLPGTLMHHSVGVLVEIWSRSDPAEAARWLANKNTQVAVQGLHQLASRWGEGDFDAAAAYADTLPETRRAAFLQGLLVATRRLSINEMRAWVSRYEGDPAYPGLIMDAAQLLIREDADAAMDLIESLPAEMRSYASILPPLAYQDPEAAVALIDDIEDTSVRDQVLPMVSGSWAQNDPASALDWTIGLERGSGRDHAIAAVSIALAGFDRDRAVDAINEIDDPDVRRITVWPLLLTAQTDDEAVRLGRDNGLDRDAVMELREQRSPMHGGAVFAPYPSYISFGSNSESDAGSD